MMRKRFLATALFATLPLAAGFAFCGKSLAQDMYQNTGASPIITSAPPVAGAMGGAAGLDYARISQLEQQVRELTNQLEQRDFQLRQLQENFTRFSNDANQRFQALESKGTGASTGPAVSNDGFAMPTPSAPAAATPPAPASTVPADVPPQPTALNTPAEGTPEAGALTDPNGAFKPKSEVNSLGQITEATPAAKTDGSITSGKAQTTNAAQAYDQAFSYLQQNNYVAAQTSFGEFLKNYPSHPLAANAQFWLGETYFSQNQFPTAAKVFAKAFQDHPQGQKAPDSLLKLALTLEKMNKPEDACLTLQELNKRFTSGPASVLKRASEEGQRMGCKS